MLWLRSPGSFCFSPDLAVMSTNICRGVSKRCSRRRIMEVLPIKVCGATPLYLSQKAYTYFVIVDDLALLCREDRPGAGKSQWHHVGQREHAMGTDGTLVNLG